MPIDPSQSTMSRRNLIIGGGTLAAMPMIANEATAQMKPARKSVNSVSFDRDRFVENCIRAHMETNPVSAVREVLTRAVSDPGAVLTGLGEPTRAGLDVLLSSRTLTIFAAAWTPQMNLLPHDHAMWALIGIYTGREDNIFWRAGDEGIVACGVNCMFEGDVATLQANAIHSVTNPLQRFTGGIHIYGGDFFGTSRSQWDPETLARGPSDGDTIRAMFARENERYDLRR